MRSELILSSLAALCVAACAKPIEGAPVCAPVSSWSAPAFRCISAPPPAPAPVVEAPPPKPEPPPEPPPKAKVSEEKIELAETVQFETDSAKLLDQSKSLLDEVVKVMNDHPEITKVQVEGYTDSTSTKRHNQKLSEERAAAVRQYLIEKGIKADRLTSKGFGQDNPVADNTTEDGRFKN